MTAFSNDGRQEIAHLRPIHVMILGLAMKIVSVGALRIRYAYHPLDHLSSLLIPIYVIIPLSLHRQHLSKQCLE